MRRKDREIGFEDGLAIIDKCEYAVLAVSDEGLPYAVPLSVCREGNNVYFHSANAGKKVDLLTDGKDVRLVFVGDVEARKNEFSTAYESAIATGKIYLVTDDETKIHALRLLSEKYCPENMPAFDRAIKQSLKYTYVYKIEINRLTAKAKRVKQ